MKSLFRSVFVFALISALTVIRGLAQFPDPKDEVKLYELAKKEGTIVWYGASPLEGMNENAKDFNAKYPGVKVEIMRVMGIAQYQRFLHETNAKQYINDILQISDYPSIKSLVQLGHLAEWKVPTSDRIPSSSRIQNSSYSPYVTDSLIAYNLNKVTPEEAKILGRGWKGLLDPRFKGRFVTSTSKSGSTYVLIHMLLDPKYADVFGPDFIKAIAAQKPVLYTALVPAFDRVVAGEHDFMIQCWEGLAFQKWEQRAPVRWVRPDPTPVFSNSWYAISKYAPHPNAARLFFNWLMSEAGALSFQKTGYQTSLKGVKDTRKAANEPWYDPVKTRYDVDWERWEKNYNKDFDFWIKTMTEGR